MTETKRGWRDVIAIHPAAELFPLMPEAQLRELGEDIRRHGLQSPIVITTTYGESENPSKDALLDGRNRLDAMELVGIPFELVYGKLPGRREKAWQLTQPEDKDWVLGDNDQVRLESPDDPYDFVLSANIHRRHLTTTEKRDLIGKVLDAKPELSDRGIGKLAHADKNTVAAVRAEKVGRGEIHHVEKREDTKGRKQPANKPAKAKPTTETPSQTASPGAAVAPEPTTAEPRAAPPAKYPGLREPSPEVVEAIAAKMAAGWTGLKEFPTPAGPAQPAGTVTTDPAGATVAEPPTTVRDRPLTKAEMVDLAEKKSAASESALGEFKRACDEWLPRMVHRDRQIAFAHVRDFRR